MGRGVTIDPSIAHTSSNMYILRVFPSRLFHHTEGAGLASTLKETKVSISRSNLLTR
jgi:hypothetical protein